MASTSKPTAVHFALVFFVMTTLILALVTYLTAKEYYASAAKAREEADKAAQNTTALNNALTDVSTLKTALGYNFESIGAGTAGFLPKAEPGRAQSPSGREWRTAPAPR